MKRAFYLVWGVLSIIASVALFVSTLKSPGTQPAAAWCAGAAFSTGVMVILENLEGGEA